MKRWMQRCAACLVAILCAVFVPGRALALETPAEARSGVVRVIVEMQTDLHSLETGEPVGRCKAIVPAVPSAWAPRGRRRIFSSPPPRGDLGRRRGKAARWK